MIFKIYLSCDREEKSKSKEHERKRKHSFIKLIDCSFFCFALNKTNVNWIVIIRDFTHNYFFIIEKSHSSLRKKTIIFEMMSIIEIQIKTQTTFFQVLTFMKFKDENCILKTRDIYNAKQFIRRKTLNALIFIQVKIINF